MAELERTMDLRVIPFLEVLVHIELDEECIMINIVKDMGLNLVALPL